jgi:hypothetical protein
LRTCRRRAAAAGGDRPGPALWLKLPLIVIRQHSTASAVLRVGRLPLFGLGLSRCHRGADRDEQGGERKAHVRSSGGVSVQPSATALVPQPPVIRARKGRRFPPAGFLFSATVPAHTPGWPRLETGPRHQQNCTGIPRPACETWLHNHRTWRRILHADAFGVGHL